MLEGVEAQRGPHAAVLEAQRAQVLDLVDPRAGAHVGAGERPPGEDRAQVPHPGAGIRLEGAELHDGVGHRHQPLHVRNEVGDEGLGHGRA